MQHAIQWVVVGGPGPRKSCSKKCMAWRHWDKSVNFLMSMLTIWRARIQASITVLRDLFCCCFLCLDKMKKISAFMISRIIHIPGYASQNQRRRFASGPKQRKILVFFSVAIQDIHQDIPGYCMFFSPCSMRIRKVLYAYAYCMHN